MAWLVVFSRIAPIGNRVVNQCIASPVRRGIVEVALGAILVEEHRSGLLHALVVGRGRIVVRGHIHLVIHAAIAHKRRHRIHCAQAKILTVLNHPLAHPRLLASVSLTGDFIAIGVADVIDQIGDVIRIAIVVIGHKMTVVRQIHAALQPNGFAQRGHVIGATDPIHVIRSQCVAIIVIARVVARMVPRGLPPARCLTRVEAILERDINAFNRCARVVDHFVVDDEILIVSRMRRGIPLARPLQPRGGRTTLLNPDQLGKIVFRKGFDPRRRAILRQIPRANAVCIRLAAVVATKTEIPHHNRDVVCRCWIGNALGIWPPVGPPVSNR